MQPIRIEISNHPLMPKIKRVIVINEFTPKFSDNVLNQKIQLPCIMELYTRSETEVDVLDQETGQPTGETEIQYGEWEPFTALGSNQSGWPTESNNRKFINPATGERVPEGTEGAIPELMAIWSQLGPAITQILTGAILGMDQRGVFNDQRLL